MPLANLRLDDPGTFVDGFPHDAFRWLRAHEPVSWLDDGEGSGFWVVTRYDDVGRVARDHARFTSERGTMLRVRTTGDGAAGKMLVVTDPPRHTRLRQVMGAAFTPRRLRALEPEVAGIVTDLVERFAAEGGGDFVARVAVPFPVDVICGLLGIPRADRPRLSRLTSSAFGADDEAHRLGPTARATTLQAHFELLDYFGALVEARRRAPDDGVVTALVAAEPDGAPLAADEIVFNCFNLLIGGNETTRHAASGGLLALLEFPEQRRRLREDPDGLPVAVEEVLRWTTPGLHFVRTATADVEVGDRLVRSGDAVSLWVASANRDEAVFDAPDRFDVGRDPNRHMTFGQGAHYCLGSALARLELRLLFGALQPHLEGMELAGDVRHLRSNFIHGIDRLPVSVRPLGRA
ncbi:MAG: cytochrome P450 [Chloroflexi bacterium]|nr:MAG: cytochrome P450 [Chloroflexota bacterium]